MTVYVHGLWLAPVLNGVGVYMCLLCDPVIGSSLFEFLFVGICFPFRGIRGCWIMFRNRLFIFLTFALMNGTSSSSLFAFVWTAHSMDMFWFYSLGLMMEQIFQAKNGRFLQRFNEQIFHVGDVILMKWIGSLKNEFLSMACVCSFCSFISFLRIAFGKLKMDGIAMVSHSMWAFLRVSWWIITTRGFIFF